MVTFRHNLADLGDLIGTPDESIDLARSALRIAMFEYPSLDLEANLAELERLARRAEALAEARDPSSRLRGVDAALFAEAGFRGNADQYYDPRNSLLNAVLSRRLGIPITLSVVYIEVARRLGLEVDGVAFPGHFFVAHRVGRRVEYIDPFDGGARLDAAAREQLGRRALPDGHSVSPEMLRPAPRRLILIRMLRNLYSIYAKGRDDARLVAVLDRLLQISPGDLEALRERGNARHRLGDLTRARVDFESYLAAAPGGEAFDDASRALSDVRRSLADRN
jgi:regulator of sirC expression with transglutaminase-like and TPR domain